MFTKFKQNNNGAVFNFVTQQYEIGTYIIVNGDPKLQMTTDKTELQFHITLRKKVLKLNDTLLDGAVIEYSGDLPLNKFNDEIRNTV